MASSNTRLSLLCCIALSCGDGNDPREPASATRPPAPSTAHSQEVPITIAGAVRLTSPRDGQVFKANDPPFQLQATVDFPGDQVLSVRFLSNGKPIAETHTPPFQANYPPARLGFGAILLRAAVTTTGGNVAESHPAMIEVRPPTGDDRDIGALELAIASIGENNVVAGLLRPKPAETFLKHADITVQPAVLSTAGDIRQSSLTTSSSRRSESHHTTMFGSAFRQVSTSSVSV